MIRFLVIAISTLAFACSGPRGEVITIAGGEAEGFRDAVGAEAQFHLPGALVVDADGVVFVADTFNHVIRRVADDGTVTSVAGTGAPGFQDGPAGGAQFNGPSGIALDATRHALYVADMDNHVIRRVDLSTGDVSTLAGIASTSGFRDGTTSEAQFNVPYHLSYRDGSDRLLVVDKLNHAVRAVNLADMMVSTIVGTGEPGYMNGTGSEAAFSSPSGVAEDSSGSLYVTDSANRVIRRVDADGSVTTVAGEAYRTGYRDGAASEARMEFPWGIVAAGDDAVIFADRFNNVLRQLDQRQVSTIAGHAWSGSNLDLAPARQDGAASEAVLWLPTDDALGPSGDLYFLDANSVRVLRGR